MSAEEVVQECGMGGLLCDATLVKNSQGEVLVLADK